jgi:pimeloyl-ACP methyl ester carboxylesterase
MRRVKWSGVLGAGLLGLGFLCASAAEAAELPFQPCGSQRGGPTIECGSVTVPLDRTGLVPGQIRLALQRVRAQPEVPLPGEAVLALAGGPGQSSTSFMRTFADELRPLLARRDLLALDTRGIGLASDLIVCRDLQDPARTRIPASVRACAAQLGSAAGRYGTVDIVEDIEAAREAAGYDRLWLVGTSYGTYTAQRYAVAHPDRVAGLVLDSVVDPASQDLLSLTRAQAIPRVLAQTCLGGACRRATDDIRRDFKATLARLPLRGHVGSASGRRLPIRITDELLFGVITANDQNPLIAAVLPSALRRAAQGDGEPLGRLIGLTLIGDAQDLMRDEEIREAAREFSAGNWVATTCRDTRWPWSAETPLGEPRLAAASTARRF